MAGTGFLLRRLASQDNFSGMVRAFFHSAIVAVGPWILIVLTLGAISLYTANSIGFEEADEFLSIIIYNLFFSFVLSAPLYVISARYVSDCLYRRDVSPVPGILITSLILLVVPATLIATLFYVFYATMDSVSIFSSVVNFVLLSEIWVVMLYLGCLRNFRAITFCWIVGMALIVFLAVNLARIHGSEGMLLGFNIGLVFLLFSQIANVFAEYPYQFSIPKDFKFYFRRYRLLFWSGLFLYAGMWIDKVIMWGAPEATTHLNHLRTYPIYDGAMFISYLSILFIMSLFIFSLETNFYIPYLRYIQHIERNAPLAQIEQSKDEILLKLKENARSFLVLQGALSLAILCITPLIFNWIGMDYLELNIFRLGVLGSFFTGFNLILFVYFSYFDSQENMLLLAALMFFSNTGLTFLTRHLGFSYYGYGYCLSMIFTFFVGSILMIRFLNQLTYHVFISNVVKRQKMDKPIEVIETLRATEKMS
jgi:polysaccharide biosynthesis protein PelG